MSEKLFDRLRSHLSSCPSTAELWIAGQAFIVNVTGLELVRNHRRGDYDVRIQFDHGGWLTLPKPMEDRA